MAWKVFKKSIARENVAIRMINFRLDFGCFLPSNFFLMDEYKIALIHWILTNYEDNLLLQDGKFVRVVRFTRITGQNKILSL